MCSAFFIDIISLRYKLHNAFVIPFYGLFRLKKKVLLRLIFTHVLVVCGIVVYMQ